MGNNKRDDNEKWYRKPIRIYNTRILNFLAANNYKYMNQNGDTICVQH